MILKSIKEGFLFLDRKGKKNEDIIIKELLSILEFS
jgi:hypothetical protein